MAELTSSSLRAARISDVTEHGGVITEGASDVLINGLGAARLKDYHTCPLTANGRVHVGGEICEASISVLVNGRGAARSGDGLLCSGPDVEPASPKDNCETSEAGKLGLEDKKIGDTRKSKSFLRGYDAKYSCWSARIIDKTATGAMGTGKATVDFLKREGKLQVGVGYDNLKDSGFAGADVAIGGSVLEGKLAGETTPVRIPGTEWGISVEGEVTGSVLTAEAKVSLGIKVDKDGYHLGGSEKLGAGLGEGVKFSISIKPLKPPPKKEPEVPQDLIKGGASDVLIGD